MKSKASPGLSLYTFWMDTSDGQLVLLSVVQALQCFRAVARRLKTVSGVHSLAELRRIT